MRIVEAHLGAEFGEVGDLVERERQEFLAAEAGVHAHDEDVVDHGENFDERLDRGGGVDDDGGFHAVLVDQLEGAMEVTADLLLDADHVGAGLGEGGDEGVGVLDHEVAVKGESGDLADGGDDGRPKGDVGDEVSVHDIDVHDGAATALGCGDLGGKVGEVRSEDREGEFDHARESLQATAKAP